MKKIYFSMGIISMAILASCTKEVKEQDALTFDESVNANNLGAAAGRQPGQNFVPNEVLVKFKKGTSETGRANALARISGNVKEHILTKAMQRFSDEGVFLVHTPLAALEAISRVKGIEVEYAEPNWIYTHDAISNDTYFTNSSLWGMNTGNGSAAVTAWGNNHTGTSNVFIGIIDEGYMYTHEDLAANAGKNPKEIENNGNDDDGNGYVDDVYGWDFDGNNNTVFDGTGDDHGTHVAGTIGGVGGNGKGVAGVVWSVKLLNAKFLGNRGGTTANAIKAVDYFTDLKLSGVNIVATNNSWGGGGFSQGLKDAISNAGAAGVLFIAAAGNDSRDIDASPSYPASYNLPNMISVASIASSGALSSFSNFGVKSVHIGAPGSSIYSTVPKSSRGKVISGYASYSGTSMATPHVAGAAALWAAYHSTATASQIKDAILNAATTTTSLNGKTITGDRLNVSSF